MQKEKPYFREKIEYNEIDLVAVLKFILIKWKVLLILCAVFYLGAIVIILFKENKAEVQIEQNVSQTESEKQLTETQQKKIDGIIKKREELEVLEKYKNTLAYMNIDPYMCNINTLQYLISSEELGEEVYEAYKTYSTSGLKKIINERLGKEIVNPSDLVTEISNHIREDIAFSENNKSYTLDIKIVSSDKDTNDKITDIVKAALEEYHKHLVSVMGKHELILLSENNYIGSDESIKQKQSEFVRIIEEKEAWIFNRENALDSDEKEALEKWNEANTNTKDAVAIVPEKQKKSITWYIVVLAVCLVMSCAIVGCYYVFAFGNKLKNGEEIMSIFELPYIGDISKADLQASIFRLEDEMKSMCLKTKSEEVFISSMANMRNIEEYFDRLKMELDQSNVKLLFGNGISDSFDAMKIARRCKNMILIFEEKRTDYQSIDSVLQRCDNWGINIIGVINICHR